MCKSGGFLQSFRVYLESDAFYKYWRSSSFKSEIWKYIYSVCLHVCTVDTTVALAFCGVWIVA